MIKNERQYRISKSQLDKFRQSIDNLDKYQKDTTIEMQDIYNKALKSQYDELTNKVKEYEELKSGNVTTFVVNSISDLPSILIKARIALGFTHKDLAKKAGLKEQQIQRYEADDYKTASLGRVKEIVNSLGIVINEEIIIPNENTSLNELIKCLKNTGFDEVFIKNRLIPSKIIGTEYSNDQQKGAAALSYLGRIFDTSVNNLIINQKLNLGAYKIGAARFKSPKNTSHEKIIPYTVYAHKLALLSHYAGIDLERNEISTDPKIVRRQILKKYKRVTFETALKFAWDLGVIVLPLRDSGVFHGASWRFEGRNVIILKQQQMYHARWLYDLLHELRHAAESPELDEHEVIEYTPIDPEYYDSEDEYTAGYFAEDVVLDSRSEELETLCINEANGNLRYLKAAVKKIARKEGVEVDSLANHLAFRLTEEGQDWWGAAQNLQIDEPNPWELARSIFFNRINLYALNEIDREILTNSLSS